MSKTNSVIKITRTLHELDSRVILFGNPSTDPDVAESKRRLENIGREVHTISRPSFDTGTGQCGKLCHCKGTCLQEYSKDLVL